MPDLPPHAATPLDGRWEMVRAEMDGEAAPELVTRQTVLELRAGAYTVFFAGRKTDHGSFTVGTEGTTNALLLHGTVGANADRAIPCIYQLVGERLRICYGLQGVAPTEFATAAGQGRYMATYRRSGIG